MARSAAPTSAPGGPRGAVCRRWCGSSPLCLGRRAMEGHRRSCTCTCFPTHTSSRSCPSVSSAISPSVASLVSLHSSLVGSQNQRALLGLFLLQEPPLYTRRPGAPLSSGASASPGVYGQQEQQRSGGQGGYEASMGARLANYPSATGYGGGSGPQAAGYQTGSATLASNPMAGAQARHRWWILSWEEKRPLLPPVPPGPSARALLRAPCRPNTRLSASPGRPALGTPRPPVLGT